MIHVHNGGSHPTLDKPSFRRKIHQSGRGSADEKVARQIGNLMRQLVARGSMISDTFHFHKKLPLVAGESDGLTAMSHWPTHSTWAMHST